MPRQRQQIDAQLVDIDRDFAERLGRVGVQRARRAARQGGDLADRLKRADLVVGVHDADERGAAVQGLAHRVGIDQSLAIDRHNRDPAAQAFEELARLQRGRMLDGAGDDVQRRCAQRPKKPRSLAKTDPFEGMIARFGAAAGEDDLVRLRTEQLGDLLPGLFDGIVRGLAAGCGCWTDCRSARADNGSMASTTAGSSGVVAL